MNSEWLILHSVRVLPSIISVDVFPTKSGFALACSNPVGENYPSLKIKIKCHFLYTVLPESPIR